MQAELKIHDGGFSVFVVSGENAEKLSFSLEYTPLFPTVLPGTMQ